MSSQNFVIKKGLTVDTTEVIDANAELTTEAFGTEAVEKIQDVVGGLLNAGTGITLNYDDGTNSLSITGNEGTITQVEAGTGLIGGGTSGHVTLNIGGGTGITVNDNDIAVNMGAFDTDDLGEGTTNLYYTQTRFNTAFAAMDTDNLSEGTSNLYFTNERVDDRVATLLTEGANITLTYDDVANTLTIAAVEDYLANNDTDDLTEGTTNLYFTNERVDDRVADLLTAGDNVTLTYDDTAGTLTIATAADITGVTAGNGLSGGGDTGAVSLAVDYDDSSIGLDGSNKLAVKASGVTNDMLAGSIINAKLVNSSVTINGSSVSLGGTVTLDTDDIGEGSTNLYHTVERVQDVVGDQFVTNGTHTGISFSYDDANDGAIDATVSLTPFSTTDLSEGTNLYYTDERVDDRVNDLMVGGTDVEYTYDDVNGTLTLDHSNVSRTDDGTPTGTLTHEGTFVAVTGVTSSAQGHVTAVETTTFTLPAGAVPNDGTLTVAGGTVLEVNVAGDSTFTADQSGNSTITLDHSAVTRTDDSTPTDTLTHEGTFVAVTGVTSSSEGHITAVETTTFTLPAGAVPNDGTLTVEGGTDLEVNVGGDSTFSADQGTAATITLDHSAVSRSNTTDSPAQLSHAGTFDAITSVTTSSTGHVTGVETSTFTLPAGAVPNNATITIAAGSGLATGGDFTTDQGTNETITLDHADTSTLTGAQTATDSVVTSVTVDGFGHVTAVGTDSTPSVENISTDWVDFVPMDTVGNPVPSQVEGRVFYHDEYKALTVYNDITGSSLQVGHEEWVRVYNNSGSTIANGTPLYVTGATGETVTVSPADASTELKSYVIGVATNDIANNAEGVATTRGLISGIDTSTLSAGARVHLGASGGYVGSAPTYPYFPVDLGTCVVSDATNGYIYVDLKEHHFESFRVTGNTHMDGNLTVDGNFTVNGTQSIVSQNNLAVNDASIYLNSGDTIGDANTTFTGSGLDDAYFTGHFEGTTTKNYYVRIDGVGTGTGGVDTFEWSYDNFSTTEATGVDITGASQALGENINIFFNATTGHTSGDSWSGSASPLNIDTGWASNRNTGTSGVGYTHMGVFFDVSDEKFKFYEEYDPEPEGEINTGHASFNLGTVVANTFEGAFSGNLTGNVTGTASNATTAATLTGLTATIAELNILDGVTATATELNVLDGITATTAELNILDGVTATATELNVLDGITATTAELNYTDGVTSNIQTQLNGKMASTATLDTVADNGATTDQTLTVGGISTSGNISANQISTSYASNAGGVARNTYQSTSAPTSGDGQVGDVWIVYA